MARLELFSVCLFVKMKRIEPVLKQALGPEWSSLAPVIQAHYGLTPAVEERIQLRGKMDRVFYSQIVSPLILVAALAGVMVPYRGHNIPVEVEFDLVAHDCDCHHCALYCFSIHIYPFDPKAVLADCESPPGFNRRGR